MNDATCVRCGKAGGCDCAVGAGSTPLSALAAENAALRTERDEAQRDYLRACQTVAEMHAAAVGEVCGPKRGVVEDVADLRAERDAAIRERDEARAEWPEWARKITSMLQEYGWQYDAEDYIDIAAEVRSWGDETDAACRSEVERADKQRLAAMARVRRLEGALEWIVQSARSYTSSDQHAACAAHAKAALADTAPASGEAGK